MGYGAIKVNRKTVGTHRVVWELYRGLIPEGKLVCHKCRNRGCVNPKHLYIGTYKDNTRDAMEDGVHYIPRKLTKEKVIEIKNLRKDGWSQRKLATRFNVHRSSIRSILSGINWGWVKT